MQHLSKFGIGLACLLVLGGCTSSNSEKPTADESLTRPTETAEAAPPANQKPYKVRFETSAGDFVVQVHPEWAPRGAARFKTLVETGFYNECRFFRVVPDFMVQWGMNGDPNVQARWDGRTIPDDPVVKSNTKGRITFATSGPDSRTTQVFINYKDNGFLDEKGFAPFGEVIEGMEAVEAINAEYKEDPSQGAIQSQGNLYLNSEFPRLDYIKTARIVEEE